MVPNVAGTGSSFKGAALYYLHDKRQEGERERLTDDRVAWAQTRNLATDDPELAWKIMAATALDQDRLKQAAGVKATGRKSNASVYAYSIAWHPEENGKLSRKEMLEAAEASIRAIGGQDRQAIIVAHNDEPHPHVHIILNRVSLTDGRMLGTSNDRLKLSEWALAYRQARGEAEKYCPERAKNIEARKNGEYVRASSETPRGMEKDYAGASAANDNSARKERDRQKSLNQQLAGESRAMHLRHRAEWTALSQNYRAGKSAIYDGARTATEKARESVKAQYRPSWGEMFRRHGIEARAFAEREKRFSGKIENAIAAVAHRRDLDPENSRGFVSDAFNFLTSQKARTDALAKLHAAERTRLAGEQRRELDRALARVRAVRGESLAAGRRGFAVAREALIAKQNAERSANQKAWSIRKDETTRAFDRVCREEQSKQSLRRQSLGSNADGGGRLKPSYEDAVDRAAAIRKRMRSKDRERDKDRDDRDR